MPPSLAPSDLILGQSDDDLASRFMAEKLHVFEPRDIKMGELERATRSLKDLANWLNMTETTVMELPRVVRQDAMFRYISRKYGVPEDQLKQVWGRC